MALSYGAQLEFARDFATYSGLSGNVVLAWCLQEQPPGHPATPGSNNWLNIQYTDSGPNETYYRIARLDPARAAYASVTWMNENQPSITRAAGKSEYDQAKAIVDSGWATSHYGGVEAFYAVVQEVSHAQLERTPPAPRIAAGDVQLNTPAPVATVRQGNDPPDRSPKIRASGKKLGETGSQFGGHINAMRNLVNRHVRY